MKRTFVCLTMLLVIKLGFTQTGFTDLVTKTEKSVVTVKTYDTEGEPLKVGTAFFVDESGILLSNFHVLSDASSVKIITLDGKEYDVKKIISSDKELDLIKFNISNPLNEHFPKLVISTSPILKGEDIFVIGSPGGFESSVSKGIVSAIRDVPEVGKLYQITAPISSGSSGSPVFNMQGEVVGIATLQYQDGQNMNFAIDISLVNKLVVNDAFKSNINIEKELPNDILEAKKIIGRLNYPCGPDDMNILNGFIQKFPNDYYGYFMRARIYSCISLPYSYGIKENSEQKRIEFLISADKDFTKALLLSSNKNIVYWYRALAKLINANNGAYTNQKLVGWDKNGAISDFNKATGLDGKVDKVFDKSRFEYIGDLKKDLNDFAGALAAYKQAITSFPESRKIYVVYGNCASIYYYDFKNLKQASIYINKAIANADLSEPNKIGGFIEWELFELRAYVRYDLNDISGALADLNVLFDECDCAEATNPYNNYLRAAIIFQMDGDYNEVIASLGEALKYQKDEQRKATYYDLRSLAYFLTKQYQMALIDRNRYFELTAPTKLTATNYSQRATIKQYLKDYTGALKDINKAIQLDFKNADLHYSKGNILYDLNDKIGAVKAYDKAIELNNKEVQFYLMRGYAKYDSDKMGACSDWSKAGEMGDYSAYDLITKYCK